MITNGKIDILENILVDKSLSKYTSLNESNINSNSSGFSLISIPTTTGQTNSPKDPQLDHLEYIYLHNQSIWIKFKIWLYKNLYLENNTKHKFISLDELKNFFDNLKDNITELDYTNINDVLTHYNTVLTNAKLNKQLALCEKLEEYANILKDELVLSTSEFNKFLDEKDVVKFYNKASRHKKYKTKLRLTYVKNFIKIIPNEVSELKTKADSLNVFDNYVILHYDYNDDSTEKTKEEKEKEKDPILFGVIRNSTRLYYIGDWIDDYCDLTLDVLIKTIGNQEKILNKSTISDGLHKNI